MREEWELRQMKYAKYEKTYQTSDSFLRAMREDKLIDGFFLSEEAFQEIVGEIASNQSVAKEISDNGIWIALKADKGQELGGILELSESFANG